MLFTQNSKSVEALRVCVIASLPQIFCLMHLLTLYSNTLDLIFYICHKLMYYYTILKQLKSSIYIHIYKYKKLESIKNIWIGKQSLLKYNDEIQIIQDGGSKKAPFPGFPL